MSGGKPSKKRLGVLLVERGLAESRTRAQEMVREGLVSVEGRTVTKPATAVPVTAALEVSGEVFPWVSRGGIKLDHALQEFSISVKGAACLDLGASTGGFTDVLLQCGAKKIYAVDVGRGQLHPRLQEDARVISLEGLHAKDINEENLPEAVDIITCDVSFISLTKVLPHALARAAAQADLVALIKPQFEVGKGNLGKGGLVKDEDLQRQVCEDIRRFIEEDARWYVQGIIKSPIEGGDGNREFLIAARNY